MFYATTTNSRTCDLIVNPAFDACVVVSLEAGGYSGVRVLLSENCSERVSCLVHQFPRIALIFHRPVKRVQLSILGKENLGTIKHFAWESLSRYSLVECESDTARRHRRVLGRRFHELDRTVMHCLFPACIISRPTVGERSTARWQKSTLCLARERGVDRRPYGCCLGVQIDFRPHG